MGGGGGGLFELKIIRHGGGYLDMHHWNSEGFPASRRYGGVLDLELSQGTLRQDCIP